MKRSQWAQAAACVLFGVAIGGCGNDAPPPPSQTDTGGSQTSGSTSTGADTGTGGGSGGGSTSASSASMGGGTGSVGADGTVSTGGLSTGLGGSTTGGSSGNETTGGMTGASTGGATGGTTGGVTGAGVSSDGGVRASDGGTGMTSGGTSTGATTGGTTGSVGTDIVTGTGSTKGNLDGYLFLFPCGSSHTGYDCVNVGCDANNHATKTFTFNVGGQSGTIYNMTFRVRGVLEGYQYVNTTADDNAAPGANKTDYFARGGQIKSNTASGADYNTYEVHVSPAVDGEPNVYYLNSINVDPHDPLAQHLTFAVDEQNKTIKVPGGGTITFTVYDSNCRSVMNCGPTAGNTCSAPRSVNLSGANPAAPASFMQPYQDPVGAYGQWLLFDITDISPAP